MAANRGVLFVSRLVSTGAGYRWAVARFVSPVVGVVAAMCLAACAGNLTSSGSTAEGIGQSSTKSTEHPSRAETLTSSRPSSTPTATNDVPAEVPRQRAVASDGRPRRALLSVSALRLGSLPVVPYRGWTDDAPGTEIQNTGVAASPHGPRGGVGPGGVGNYQVTAHRMSSTAAFADLPSLRTGHRVVVEAGGVGYVYEIRRTRGTSFRSQRSLAEQRAAVPGRPGAAPARAYITLSTCATTEDHAARNYWADRFSNPEHRIDKIGVLVRTFDATARSLVRRRTA